jgi:putative FmdB family regulatory protein
MPIYAYRCSTCGHAKDVLQKVSDPLLSTCPACGAETFSKQVTAAGFQLKGSGWYVTDFRNGGGGAAKPDAAAGDAAKGAAEGSKPEGSKSEGAPAEPAKADAPKAEASKSGASAAPPPGPAPAQG